MTEPEQGFRPTGDPELDEALRGCSIPPSDAPTEPEDYYELFGDAGSADAEGEFAVRVRGRRDRSEAAEVAAALTPTAALRRAFEVGGFDNPVAEWRGRDRLAILDVDWHGTAPAPRPTARVALMFGLRPVPALAWLTPRGLHAAYAAASGMRAGELAAAAAVCVLGSDPDAEVEVITRTTLPRGKVSELGGSTAGALALWSSREVTPANEAAVGAWLDERGLAVGARYPHKRCPWSPGPNSQGGEPVVVLDEGVTCFVCRARGRGGFAPLPALAGGYREGRLLTAARAAVHFDHARHLIAAECPRLPEPLRRPAWSCMLRLALGPDDPRIARAMVTHYVVRGAGGVWLDALTFDPVSPQVGQEVTRRLPCAQRIVQGDGGPEARLDPERHDLLRTNQRLRGLAEIVPVRGAALWAAAGREYAETDRVRAVAPHDAEPPRVLPAAELPPRDEVAGFFAERFPGISVPYLELLVCARAHAESGLGLVPMIAATGPTGSGKTVTVSLAAAVVGDRAEAILLHRPEQLHMAIGDASMRAGYLLLDEYGKVGRPDQLIAGLLGLSREFSYRRLYAGQVTVPLNLAVVMTNTELPESIRSNAQLGRRVVLAELATRGPDWQETCGTGDARAFRTDPECARWADALMTHAVGRLQGRFADTAAGLGFGTLEQSHASGRGSSEAITESLVRDLFRAIAEAMPTPRPLDGPGWRLVVRDGEDEASRLWAQICDDPATRDGFAGAAAVSEIDVGRALGAEEPVLLRTRGPHGRRLAVRFEDARGRYNEDIPCGG